jgi:glutamate dehydrogenase
MAVGTREDRRGRSAADRLRPLLARRAQGAEAAQIDVFAHQLLLRADAYLSRLADEEVAALVNAAFRFYAAPGPALRVRAQAPSYASEGWDAPVSVIETCVADRPFVVDTIRSVLAAEGIRVDALLHPIFAARRDPGGRLELLAPPESAEPHVLRESFTHIAIPRTTDPGTLGRLEGEIRARLEDVLLVTDDFELIVARAQAVAADLDALGRGRAGAMGAEATAVADFLRWLVDGAFVFLGYREYGLTTLGAASLVQVRPGTGLGLLRRETRSAFAEAQRLDELPAAARERLAPGRLLTVAKTIAESPVHRRVRMDDIGVKQLDAEGRVLGERRFLGLFTSKAHAEEAAEVPVLRRMLRQILSAEGVVSGSHDHKAIVAVFNTLPKSALLAATTPEVRADIRTILTAARTTEVVVSLRAEAERVRVLVVLPRDRFSSEARTRVREALATHLGGTLLEEDLVLDEEDRAVLHYAFATAPPDASREEALRAAIALIVRTWAEQLREELVERHGAQEGARLAARYADAFPDAYPATVPAARAAVDVGFLAAAERDGKPRVALANDERADTTALRFYLAGEPLVLSEFMPVLENLGLRALAEDQVIITPAAGRRLALQTFHVQDRAGRRLDVDTVGPRLADVLLALRARRIENDVLNRLVLEAGLDWRAVHCLRTYAGYAVQSGVAARAVVLGALAEHASPARLLFECFAARFRPEIQPAGGRGEASDLRVRFLASLDEVKSLREDTVLRTLLDVVEATVRTNFFAREALRDHIAIKIRAADLPHLPVPRPLYELYVHSAAMEGIHLRAGKIARGGIRRSDRPDDFRTEILGLMKTQRVKNAIIVPTGAKGGFIVKTAEEGAVAQAYETLIRGLLDLTDNLVGGRVVHPRDLVIHDEQDPYLVVAADKGTAGFSDLANRIAAEYGFWLGDAFASGGSHGYDHKALGITARGAWECVRTHFRELAIEADTAPLTVAGIGDMSGDVFGNGLLRSPHLRLRAAFNHLHVFLDPDPDPARSFAERRRLFAAVLGWDAYDPAVLSPGGAVVLRAAKRVTLSPEAQAMLGVAEREVSGERLVQTLLTLDVDLLWNGGIGTYVAATGESDAEIRDPANDAVRIRAAALRTRVIAEGGNLGFTQRARLEYALAGGRINTDAVDNSGGVDLSDHEVNLKICVQPVVESGALTMAARNALLTELTDDVVSRVLAANRAQSRLLGRDQLRSRTHLVDLRDLQAELERAAGLDRVLEALPDREALRARRGSFLGLTRPELAVLMAYTKLHLQETLLGSTLLDDPLLAPYLTGYFPAPVAERFADAVAGHRLRREIIATELANSLVDTLGMTFVHRLARDTGASLTAAVRAAAITWRLAGVTALAAAVTAGNYPLDVETACFAVLERTCERVAKWLLASADDGRSAADVAAQLAADVPALRARLAEWLTGSEAEAFQKLLSELEIAGIAAPLARDLATAEWLAGILDVVTVGRERGVASEDAAACYYALGQHLDFAWLWQRLAEAAEDDRWQRRAVEGLVEDLLRARRALTARALGGEGSAAAAGALQGVHDLLRDLRAAPRVSLAALQVVVREIRTRAEASA